jgi:hypothetical protein
MAHISMLKEKLWLKMGFDSLCTCMQVLHDAACGYFIRDMQVSNNWEMLGIPN